MYGREGRPTPLGAAFGAYGRIAKTEHLLRVADPADADTPRGLTRAMDPGHVTAIDDSARPALRTVFGDLLATPGGTEHIAHLLAGTSEGWHPTS
ncbi:hypothetical protein [Streptomyces venezuelae]|uniref:hypothetical protein n=1 Tax=Streptomyces venezuelae TaxID=54571 RepID=UPI00379E2352